MLESLIWGLLGYVIFPLWLMVGLIDYALHQRTEIARTAGVAESRLHLIQALEVGIPVVIVLFLELNLPALAMIVAAVVAHTVTAYWDLRYASRHRLILPLEQMMHAFLVVLPLIAAALIVVLSWPVVHASSRIWSWRPGDMRLQFKLEPWDWSLIALVLLASVLFGMLPAVAEWWQGRRVAAALDEIEAV